MPGPMSPQPNADRWRLALASAAVARDLSVIGIARYGEVHVAEAEATLAWAASEGLFDEHGEMSEYTRAKLSAELPSIRVAAIHASAARYLFAEGPGPLLEAIRHARDAGTMVPMDEIVTMADQGGRLSLATGNYGTARALLELAHDLDVSDDRIRQGKRLCDLAAALDGLGDVPGARKHLARAVTLGELAHDASLTARAATQHALAVDWYAGDPQTSGLLQRADSMPLSHDDRTRVHAARAFAEHRIPIVDDAGQQLAWVTRPTLARSIANDALADSAVCAPDVRLLALLAWRTTHRAPQFLNERKRLSAEALDLAQQLRMPSLLMEAAVACAVDALEAADRPGFDRSVAVARWVGERDGNPRLRWRASSLAAGVAHLDGDRSAAVEFRVRAREEGAPLNVPGWLSAELMLLGQEVIKSGDTADIAPFLFDESSPVVSNPLARAGAAYLFAHEGDLDTAERYARKALRQLDEEASYLLLASRIARVAVLIEPTDLASALLEILTPWSERVAIDSNAWACDGPVSLTLAELHHHVGNAAEASALLAVGEATARSIGDARSLRRAALLRVAAENDTRPRPAPTLVHAGPGLTERELRVLELLSTAATYNEIAERIAFSTSTVRNDAVSIYRKLGVRGRAQAVARASALGFVLAQR